MDECPLGMVEKAPASLRAPGAGVVRTFASDRQKHEAANSEGILTKIVTGGGAWGAAGRGQGAGLRGGCMGGQGKGAWGAAGVGRASAGTHTERPITSLVPLWRAAHRAPAPFAAALVLRRRAHRAPAPRHPVHQELLDDGGRARHQHQRGQVGRRRRRRLLPGRGRAGAEAASPRGLPPSPPSLPLHCSPPPPRRPSPPAGMLCTRSTSSQSASSSTGARPVGQRRCGACAATPPAPAVLRPAGPLSLP